MLRAWLENLAYANAMIVPKHILEEESQWAGGNAVSKGGGDFSRNPVGSGPYKLVEWKTNEYIKLRGIWRLLPGCSGISKEIIFKVAGDS